MRPSRGSGLPPCAVTGAVQLQRGYEIAAQASLGIAQRYSTPARAQVSVHHFQVQRAPAKLLQLILPTLSGGPGGHKGTEDPALRERQFESMSLRVLDA